MCNLSYIISKSAILKILTVIIGILSLYGGIRGYMDSDHNKQCRDTDNFRDEPNVASSFGDSKLSHTLRMQRAYCEFLWMERCFLCGVAVITLISIILFVTFLLSETVANSTISNVIDFCFHFAGSILLIICGIFMAFSVTEIDDNICKPIVKSECQLFYEKIGAAGLALLDGIFFGAIVLSVNKIRTFEKFEQV